MEEKEPFCGSGSPMLLMQARNEVAILEAIKDEPKSVKQVAEEVGLCTYTVHKLFRELRNDGLVSAFQPNKKSRTFFYKLNEIKWKLR
jgi:predicted ArsR family transcriptional regulator